MSTIKIVRGHKKPLPVAYHDIHSGCVYIPREAKDGGGCWSNKGGRFIECSYTHELFQRAEVYEPLWKGDKLEIHQAVTVVTL